MSHSSLAGNLSQTVFWTVVAVWSYMLDLNLFISPPFHQRWYLTVLKAPNICAFQNPLTMTLASFLSKSSALVLSLFSSLAALLPASTPS